MSPSTFLCIMSTKSESVMRIMFTIATDEHKYMHILHILCDASTVIAGAGAITG